MLGFGGFFSRCDSHLFDSHLVIYTGSEKDAGVSGGLLYIYSVQYHLYSIHVHKNESNLVCLYIVHIDCF